MRTTRHTKRFKDDFERCKANPNHEEDLDGLLETVLELLENDRQLPVTNRDHQLSGKWKGYRGRWKKGKWKDLFFDLLVDIREELSIKTECYTIHDFSEKDIKWEGVHENKPKLLSDPDLQPWK